MTREEFIKEHRKVCHRVGTGNKRFKYTRNSKYYGRRVVRTKTEGVRVTQCAKNLWKKCEELGIQPVLHHTDLPEVTK